LYVPDYKIGLLVLGQVSLKWIALAGLAFIVLSLDVRNPGGGIAHISAALVGVWYALRIKRGRDITRLLNTAIDFVVGLFNGRSWRLPEFKRRKQAPSPAGQPSRPAGQAATPPDTVSEEELDIILGKIKVAGYDALTDEEKDKLFKASRRRTV
ncbi:MAG: rhomboid family intramembrane serine protease, partial [Muribaculaceae bacterium]|nr:rhomboid family intramembrane serine protease [Muribaculaceae bacterium]